MNNLGDKSNFFKNPIGVIGIFLVLTEAIASMVIVQSSLNDIQNTILVIFIVSFPCLVLFVFYLLVTQHHEKLYSPSDYKDETNFVNTYNNTTQKDEIKIRVGSDSKKLINEETDEKFAIVKEALSDIMTLQKRIIPTVEASVLSDDEKTDFVSSMDEYLLEMEEEDNSLHVDISPMYKSTKLLEELRQQGYSANIYRFGMENKKVVSNVGHEAIWLGSEVPVDMAVSVLKIAKKYYSHLKYVYLNDASEGPEYVKYQIYIGGSSDTAKEKRLRILNGNDFNKLFELNTKDELHEFVKKFDPYYD